MRLHYLQHVPYEPPGTIADWAADRGHDLTGTRLFAGESLPDVEDFDWLIVMGGPMGVHDRDTYPWLDAETDLIRRAVESGRVVLGVCLGAQLIAHALGADVYPAEESEIGWFPVEATSEATDSPIFAGLADTYEAFHWHGDTFDLPAGATLMARTEACTNQAFVYDDRVVGLQFHLESTPETVVDLLENTDSLPAGDYVQDRRTIREGSERADGLEARMRTLLDNLSAHAGRGASET